MCQLPAILASLAFTPEAMRSKVLKSFLKLIIFSTLFTFFILFYFIHQTNYYLKGSTTFASRVEKVQEFDMPVLVLFMTPIFKSWKNNNISISALIEDPELANMSILDFFDEATYNLNADLEIEFQNKSLYEGINDFETFLISVRSIDTFLNGRCQMIRGNPELKPSDGIKVNVRLNEKEDSNVKRNVAIILASNQTWYGIVSGLWSFVKPTYLTMDFDYSNYYLVEMHVKQSMFQQGQKDITACLSKVFDKIDCDLKCSTFFLPSKTLPECKTFGETSCIFGEWSTIHYFTYKKCLKPINIYTYEATPINVGKNLETKKYLTMWLSFSSDEMEIQEAEH